MEITPEQLDELITTVSRLYWIHGAILFSLVILIYHFVNKKKDKK